MPRRRVTNTEAQAALEEAGETENVASINRDPDLAQQITFEAENYIGVYASDTSIAAAIEAGATILEAVAEALNKINETDLERALNRGLIDPQSALDQLINNCGVGAHASRGFSLWDLIVSPAYAQEGCTLTTIGGEVIVIHDVVSCIEAMGVAVYHQFIGMPWNISAYAAGIGLGAMEYGEALVELASDPVALGGQLLGFALEVVSDPRAATLKYGAAIVNSLQAQAYGYLAAMANGNYEEAGRIGSGLAIDIVIKIVTPAVGSGLAVVSLSSPIGKLYERLRGPGGANSTLPNGYTRNADGTVTGPQGGTYSTAGTDLNGAQVYRDSGGRYYRLDGGTKTQVSNPAGSPNVTITQQQAHHQGYVNDITGQLEAQGYIVRKDVTFGSSCGTSTCRPDIIYIRPGETQVSGVIEIKTGNGPNTSNQVSIYPQISSGDAIPSGPLAQSLGLRPGVALRDQGYPNGIPVYQITAPGL